MKLLRSEPGLTLRKHQQENLDFFRAKARAISMLPYGSGKTAVAVRRIADLLPKHRALVVTTTGTIYKWIRDLKMWGDPGWEIVNLTGKAQQRVKLFRTRHNIAVINYEGLRVMLGLFKQDFPRAYQVIVFDEIHRVKNQETILAKEAAFVAHPRYADYVYALTGSPVLESPLDIFSIMQVVNQTIFGTDFEAWRERYFDLEGYLKEDGTKSFPIWKPKPGALDFLAHHLHSISFRRERDQLDMTFPKQIFGDPLVGELEGEALRVYKKIERDLVLSLQHQTISLEHVYPRLEKMCQVSRGWAYDAKKVPFVFNKCPAIPLLRDYMEDVRGVGRVVIWAVRPPDISLVAATLTQMGLTWQTIHGRVRSLKQRHDIVDAFNQGEWDVLICHPRCVGEGLDLEANFSLRYSYRWSALEWEQPIGRFARYVSTAAWVDYRDVVIRGTVDEGIIASVGGKGDIGKLIQQKRVLPWLERSMFPNAG